jgi:hypothetical protein
MKNWIIGACLFAVAAIICLVWINSGANHVNASETAKLLVEKSGNEFVLKLEEFGEITRSASEIKNEKLINLPESKGKVIIWNEASVDANNAEQIIHKCAISLDGTKINVVKEVSYDILLRFEKFDPLVKTSQVPDALAARNAGKDEATYIVQFVSQPLDEYQTIIAKLGGKRYTYLANHSYLMIMNAETKAKVESLPFVRWVGQYHPAYKLEDFLIDGITRNNLPKMRYNVMLLERGAEMQNKVAASINATGGKINLTIPQGYRFEATLTPEQLSALAQENEVLFIDRWSKPENDMDLVRNVGGANFIENTLGFTGQGVRGEVLDAGVLATHTDFNSGLPLLAHGSNNVDSHGTATYGINFGRGTTSAAGKGMLPEAQGIFADYDFLTNRYTHTEQLKQAPYFAVYQSNSWGSALTTAYTTISAEMDDILFKNDILILNSQSNAGTQSSRPQAWAKNVVSIGGVRHFNTPSFDDDRWQNGGSTGPAADGRIKPDLAYFYDSVTTTTSTNNTAYTTSFGGTSAATPITAGHFGIFFQMWHNGMFGNTPRATVFESAPHMTTSKAIMINNAVPWNIDAPSDVTRIRQGWGRADLQNLYQNRNKMLIIDETDVVTNLQTQRYSININDSTKPLKATMTFADPMGNPASAQSRINNLSLKVTAPNGTVYWGNNGMLTSRWTTAGGTENNVDTLENVFIEAPATGLWIVEVSATELVQDARPETAGTIDADYALVVSYARQTQNSVKFDFEGDGKSDISIFRPALGQWWYSRSSDNGTRAFQFGTTTDKIVPADYTGDGKTDIATFTPSTGTWNILRSDDSTFYGFPFGGSGDITAPADYDGDGKADPAVFRTSNSTWFVLKSSGGTTIQQFGASGDAPAVADYDGDGKADLAIYRVALGQWWRVNSSDGSNRAFTFGTSADKPIQGDYTGDGKADIAFFRPTSGEWFVLRSEDSSFYSFPFGASGDIPSSGDYDGDGKFDAAVFRSSNATWYMNRSTSGVGIVGFGANGDQPVPNAFVP